MPIEHFKRYFGYTFWTVLEVIVGVGLQKLIIFPIAAYLLGKEKFGFFLFSFGIVMIIGMAPSGGLVAGVIRHITELDEPTKRLLVSTSLRLCRIAMLVIVSIGLIVLGILRYFCQADPEVINILIPLLILLYSWNLFDLKMVRYRVERRFALRTAWCSLVGVLLFIAIPAAMFGGVVGIAWAYMFCYLAADNILSWRQGILFKKSGYDPKLAAMLKKVWFHISIATALALSSRYIYRIILGVFYSYSKVAVLFGATNIIDMCVLPMSILSSLLLSMLGAHTRLEDFGKRQRYIVFGAAVSIGIVAPLFLFFAGPFILSIMFPKFADESAQIMRGLVMIIPCSAIEFFSRPFVIKFGPIKLMPMLVSATLIAHLIPAIVLIPRLGIRGAVISYNIGYGSAAFLWLGGLVWTFKFSRSRETGIAPSCSESYE